MFQLENRLGVLHVYIRPCIPTCKYMHVHVGSSRLHYGTTSLAATVVNNYCAFIINAQ